VTKFAAARIKLPMVAVATNLAHNKIASPISTLDNDAGRDSYSVPAPIAVLVDLDLIAQAPPGSVRGGIGDIVSNLSATTDWEAAHLLRGEAIDGLAVSLSRTTAQAVIDHPGTLTDDTFLTTLAENLMLSKITMVVADSSRPSSEACHEISHAIDLLYPQRRGFHSEQVGLGAAFAWFLRGDFDRFHATVDCLYQHSLPMTPLQLKFNLNEFTKIVTFTPQTQPNHFTILKKTALTPKHITIKMNDFNNHTYTHTQTPITPKNKNLGI
jgi:glycerol-1-phosphate dehydrogenase [NAD(P)+]